MSWFGSDGNQEVGRQVLSAYYEEAIKYPEFSYSSYDAWITFANSRVPEFDVLVGELINNNSASTTVGEAASRLLMLANQSAGQATWPQIVSAAGGRGDTVNWVEGIPEIVTETGSQVLSAVQNVGTGALSTINLMKYMPWILGGAAVLYITVLAKGQGGAIGKLLGRK